MTHLKQILSQFNPYSGTQCKINLASCQLHLISADGQEKAFDLPASRRVEAPVLQASGREICLLDAEKSHKQALVPWEMELEYGLNCGPEGCFLTRGSDQFEPYLLQSQSLIYPGSYTRRPAQGPFDMFVSEDRSMLAVVNRQDAQVAVFDLQTQSHISTRQFEVFVGPKVVSVGLDTANRTLWITGADSRELWCWQLESDQVERVSGRWQYPTAVLVNDDKLWLLDAQQKSQLYCFRLPELELLEKIPLAGSSYAHQTDTPADLLQISPDGQRLAVLTQVSIPDPLTPKVTVIEIESLKTAGFQPSNRTWPSLLATAKPNQAYKNLMKQQAESGLGSEEMSGVVQALLASYSLTFARFRSSLLILKAEAAPVMDLPAQTRDLVLDQIQKSLQAEHGVNFGVPPRSEAEKEIIVHAERILQLLRKHENLELVLHRLLQHHTIGLKINRQELLGALQQRGLLSSAASGLDSTPANVAELEVPLLYALPRDWISVADPLNSRLMQLNASLQAAWLLDSSLFEVYRPVDVAWIDEGFVVLDSESGRISAWSESGKMRWSLQSASQSWNRMRLHASGKKLLLLGIDTVKGLLEAYSPEGELHWQTPDSPDSRVLDAVSAGPTQIWLLHQGGQLSLVNCEDGSQLKSAHIPGFPTAMAGEERLALFDGQVQQVHLLNTDTLELQSLPLQVSSDRFRIHHPLNVQWRNPKEIVIYDAYRLLRLNIETGELNEHLLQSFQLKSGQQNQAPINIFTALAQRQQHFQGGSRQSLHELLSRVPLFQQAPDDFLTELAGLMRTRVFNRGDQIVRKGEHGDEMFLIRQGEVEVMGARLTDVVARMGAGDIFGEVALMMGQKRNATVRAGSYCEVFCLNQTDLDTLLPFYPMVRERLLQLSQERHLQEQLRSEGEQERLRSRIQALAAQRQQDQPVRRSPLLAPQPPKGITLLPLNLWARHVQAGQLAKINREGQVLQLFGDQRLILQPVAVAENTELQWVLDTAQNHLLQIDGAGSNRSFGHWPLTQLEQPRDLALTPEGGVWVANTGQAELLKIAVSGELEQQLTYGRAPASVCLLENGNLLVADMREHTVSEITPSGELCWQYGTPRKFGRDENLLFSPEYALRLSNGNTLIADTGNSRIIEVDADLKIVWSLLSAPGIRMIRPTRVLRLEDQHTLIEHSNRMQWLEVSPEQILAWRFTVPAQGFNQNKEI